MDRFEQVRDQVKEGTDLVALVEEFVHLKPRGRYHMGLCPFHKEKTPSFAVYSDRQYFQCYGCGKAGDVFSFLMERDGIGFREALEILAERLGVSTEGCFGGGRGPAKPRVDFHGTLSKVRDWFRHMLQTGDGKRARDYLESRGLTDAIESFGLGYHPARGLADFVQHHDLSRQVVEQAGLLGKDGYERFAGRLMFPIEDERGRVVGFGGRVLEGDAAKAKYLNSPESPFFNKRRLLFGLRAAKNANNRKLVVMEGYTDVITAHLAGMTGAVASLGTALTTDHTKLLERFATDGVVLLFDGDRAGRLAADRAFRELVHSRLPVRIALLPDGTDPDDLVGAPPDKSTEEVEAGRAKLQGILDSADDALTVWFRLRRQEMDLTLDANVERTTEECARILAGLEDPVRREALTRRMGQHLGIAEDTFRQTVFKVQSRQRRRAAPATPPPSAEVAMSADGAEAIDYDVGDDVWEQASVAPVNRAAKAPAAVSGAAAEAELDVLACVFSAPELLAKAASLEVTVQPVREILALMQESPSASAEGPEAGSPSKDQIVGYVFMRCAERPDLRQLVARCLRRAEHIKTPLDTFSRLEKDRDATVQKARAQQIRYQLQEARAQGDKELVARLTQDYLAALRQRGSVT